VARVWERTFLDYGYWVAAGRVVRYRVAPAALAGTKDRVRESTSRKAGRSIESVAKDPGCTPAVFAVISRFTNTAAS